MAEKSAITGKFVDSLAYDDYCTRWTWQLNAFGVKMPHNCMIDTHCDCGAFVILHAGIVILDFGQVKLRVSFNLN